MNSAPDGRRRSWLIALTAAATTVSSSIGRPQPASLEQRLPPLGDLRTLVATVGRHKAPLLILFSTPGCPYCLEVRRNYLLPRAVEQSGKAAPELLLREVDITSQQPIVDTTGARMTEAAFAARLDVRVVPVVALFDQNLRMLASPVIGLDRAGFYEGILASAIETARKQLQAS